MHDFFYNIYSSLFYKEKYNKKRIYIICHPERYRPLCTFVQMFVFYEKGYKGKAMQENKGVNKCTAISRKYRLMNGCYKLKSEG